MSYVNEGSIIMFRVGYAFFKFFHEEIRHCRTKPNFSSKIKHLCDKLTLSHKITFLNYIFNKKSNFHSLSKDQETNLSNFIAKVYQPVTIKGHDSKLVTGDQIIKLYNYLPWYCKASDPIIVYSFEKDGRSFN